MVKHWSEEEKQVFMERFLQVGEGGGGRGRGGGEAGVHGALPAGSLRTSARSLPSCLARARGTAHLNPTPPPYTPPLFQFPKDFRKISAFLPGKSTGDCVGFFYKHQKLDEFAVVRRKQQLKKRRLQADARRQTYAPLLVAPTGRWLGRGGALQPLQLRPSHGTLLPRCSTLLPRCSVLLPRCTGSG